MTTRQPGDEPLSPSDSALGTRHSALRLDLFTEVQCPPGESPERRLDELMEQAERADALGYHGLWVSEIHFQPEFSLLSAPYVVLGAVAARTRRLRLGVAVNLLPVHHPLHLAEHAATLDVLSHGRAQFAMGRGHLYSRVYEGFGADRDASREVMEESLRLILAAWTHSPLEFHGQHFDVPEVAVAPRPVQQPHPPVFWATTSHDGVDAAARLGVNVFFAIHLIPRADLFAYATAYWDGLRRHGRDPAQYELGLNVPIHVAPTTAAAHDAAREGFMDYFRVNAAIREGYLEWRARQGRTGPPLPERQATTFERLVAEAAVVGDPPTVAAALRRLVADTGATRLLCWMNMGSIPHAAVLRSLGLFAREVSPNLQPPAA
jgi:alkanesulfonate monooxygenase SsuD/methylene tetrahydromethanopterin reductase-like flavin-dependent oxidoreductase (luciferase family)